MGTLNYMKIQGDLEQLCFTFSGNFYSMKQGLVGKVPEICVIQQGRLGACVRSVICSYMKIVRMTQL